MIYSYGETVRVTVNPGVAGLAITDFTVKLLEDGATSSLTVQMTELTNLGTGLYQFRFTPPTSSTRKNYYLRIVYGGLVDSSWDITPEPPVAGRQLAIEINAGSAGLTLLQETTRDGNTDAGITWAITEVTDAGTGIYRATATLPDYHVPYTLAVRFYVADLSVDSVFDVIVQPSTNNLLTLNEKLRDHLNNPETTELSDTQLGRCWTRAVDRFSQFQPKRAYDYTLVTVASQKEYDLPAETFGIRACRLYSSLTTLKDELQYFDQYQDERPYDTGYAGWTWAEVNNQLQLSEEPASTEAGIYIGLLLYKSHVFTNNACTTIPRTVMESSIMDWAKGDALETWAGYQGQLTFGTAREDREGIRKEGQRLKTEAEKRWAAGR